MLEHRWCVGHKVHIHARASMLRCYSIDGVCGLCVGRRTSSHRSPHPLLLARCRRRGALARALACAASYDSRRRSSTRGSRQSAPRLCAAHVRSTAAQKSAGSRSICAPPPSRHAKTSVQQDTALCARAISTICACALFPALCACGLRGWRRHVVACRSGRYQGHQRRPRGGRVGRGTRGWRAARSSTRRG
jgi:hypothetical protein